MKEPFVFALNFKWSQIQYAQFDVSTLFFRLNVALCLHQVDWRHILFDH